MAGLRFQYCFLLLPFFLTGCNSPERQLTRMWPEKRPLLSTAVVAKGYLYTKAGDTLRGYIKVDPDYPLDYISLLPFNKTSQTDIVKVQTDQIDYVNMELFPGKGPVNYMPVKFKSVKQPHFRLWHGKPLVERSLLFQILGTRGQTRLGYREWGAGDADGNATYYGELILTSLDSINILTKNRAGLASDSRFLLSFINKRYHQHFKKDEMDVKARIDYILDRENFGRPIPVTDRPITSIHRKDYTLSGLFCSFTSDKRNIHRITDQILLKTETRF